MMRILFTLLVLLLVAIGLGWTLQQSAGEVVFSYGEWTVQISIVVFAVLAGLLFLLGYGLFRALGKLLRAPADLRRWSDLRRQRRAEKLLNRGLLAMLEGDWRGAEQALDKGASLTGAPLVNYLGTAQAAYRQGDAERCNHYLALARQHDDSNSPALGLAQARLQIDRQQPQQADDTLRVLGDKHEQVNLMLLETATALKDWARAARLVQQCSRSGAVPAPQARAQQLTSYLELLRRAAAEPEPTALETVWRAIPNRLKKDNALIGAYVQARVRHENDQGCEALLRRALKRQWDENLINLFGQVRGRNPKAQLEFAERCLPRRPEDAALLLTLGRLCITNELWGKAVRYLEQSARLKPEPTTCRELATLLAQQGDHTAAARYYQQGLGLMTGAGETGNATGTLMETK